jgi:cyclopropane fatty-acyl-phospholipid synthase-like methyltransferase/predicted transcriptional regulator
MKPKTSQDISWMMSAYIPAAALGAAMESGLFWLLEEQPMAAEEVAEALGIPSLRCRYWLEYLHEMGLLEFVSGGYSASETTHKEILEARSQDTWAFLAEEARERLPAVQDLSFHIRDQGSVWKALSIKPPDYVAKMRDHPDNARRFTRMLYELHQEEANQVAEKLDMDEVKNLLDVGGGSGVMSLALLRRHPELRAVVIDQPNVCAEGRVIARENNMEGRISFEEVNFLKDDLPTGFDMVMECDVGVYTRELFQKILAALNPGGRFVILDYQFETEAASRLNLMSRAFFNSLGDPEFAFETEQDLIELMMNSGFTVDSEPFPVSDGLVIVGIKSA